MTEYIEYRPKYITIKRDERIRWRKRLTLTRRLPFVRIKHIVDRSYNDRQIADWQPGQMYKIVETGESLLVTHSRLYRGWGCIKHTPLKEGYTAMQVSGVITDTPTTTKTESQ